MLYWLPIQLIPAQPPLGHDLILGVLDMEVLFAPQGQSINLCAVSLETWEFVGDECFHLVSYNRFAPIGINVSTK